MRAARINLLISSGRDRMQGFGMRASAGGKCRADARRSGPRKCPMQRRINAPSDILDNFQLFHSK